LRIRFQLIGTFEANVAVLVQLLFVGFTVGVAAWFQTWSFAACVLDAVAFGNAFLVDLASTRTAWISFSGTLGSRLARMATSIAEAGLVEDVKSDQAQPVASLTLYNPENPSQCGK
jgi:hypothetical protein